MISDDFFQPLVRRHHERVQIGMVNTECTTIAIARYNTLLDAIMFIQPLKKDFSPHRVFSYIRYLTYDCSLHVKIFV